MKDLLCLVADRNMKAALQSLLGRHEAFGIRPVGFDIFPHPERDPGCFKQGPAYLRGFQSQYQKALILFDRDWDGAPTQDAHALEQSVRNTLSSYGLGGWAEVIVIEPELERWVWSDSPEVDRCLGWQGRQPSLRDWLRERGLWSTSDLKPADPKRAVECALKAARIPRSSSIYADLANSVSVQRCQDVAFSRLRNLLRDWFSSVPR